VASVLKHLGWRKDVQPFDRLNQISMRLIQSGCIYIFGRDRHYRPTFVVDGFNMVELAKKEEGVVNGGNLCQAFCFLFNYMKRVMFLPGQVDHCNLIVNLGNMSVFEMPRKTILAFSSVLQDNMHFMMAKSFYLNLSWA
jgi:CRAL/TRIO domain